MLGVTIPISIPASPIPASAKPIATKSRAQNDSDDKKAGHASFADVLGEQKAEDAESRQAEKTEKGDGSADSESKLKAKTEPKKKAAEDGSDVAPVPVVAPSREQPPIPFLNLSNWSSMPVNPEEKQGEKSVPLEDAAPAEEAPKTASDGKPAIPVFFATVEPRTPKLPTTPITNEQRFELAPLTGKPTEKVTPDHLSTDLPKLTVKATLEPESAPKQPLAFKLEVAPKEPVEQTQTAQTQKPTLVEDKHSQPVVAQPDEKVQPLDKTTQNPTQNGASPKQGDTPKERQSFENAPAKTPPEERSLPKDKQVSEKRITASETPTFADVQLVSKSDVTPTPKKIEETSAIKAPAAPAPANPTNGIRLRLETANQNNPVNVHLTERGGQVHISVRGADQQLNGVLRQELPDLLRKLDEQGLQASAWTPPAEGRVRTAESSSSEFSQQQQGADPQGRNFNQDAQQQNNRERERQDQRMMGGKTKTDWNSAWTEFDLTHTNDLFGARQ